MWSSIIPSCGNYALRKTAADNENKYVSNEATAIKLIEVVRKICADGGFYLTKFVSNKKQVLGYIPEEECRKGIFDQDLELGMLPTEKVLGI